MRFQIKRWPTVRFSQRNQVSVAQNRVPIACRIRCSVFQISLQWKREKISQHYHWRRSRMRQGTTPGPHRYTGAPKPLIDVASTRSLVLQPADVCGIWFDDNLVLLKIHWTYRQIFGHWSRWTGGTLPPVRPRWEAHRRPKILFQFWINQPIFIILRLQWVGMSDRVLTFAAGVIRIRGIIVTFDWVTEWQSTHLCRRSHPNQRNRCWRCPPQGLPPMEVVLASAVGLGGAGVHRAHPRHFRLLHPSTLSRHRRRRACDEAFP
jgi:hypothetical protein